MIVETEALLDPTRWARLIAQHEVTIWHSVPALLELLVDEVSETSDLAPRKLRLALLGGDWIPVTLPDRLKAMAEEVHVVSMGGATEVSMDSTIYDIVEPSSDWKSIPYGRPMANQTAYVLDKFLRPVPVGVPGELHLGGVGVGRGDLKRPELTAEKFVCNDFASGSSEKLYKTGDLACYSADGNLELLGRIDFRVKIHGHRIELREIEAVLRQHPAVREAVVVSRTDASDAQRLVAYVVPNAERAAPLRHLLHLENEGLLDDTVLYELPNGLLVAHLNKSETDFIYQEIFGNQDRLKHGIHIKAGDCVFDVGANIGPFCRLR